MKFSCAAPTRKSARDPDGGPNSWRAESTPCARSQNNQRPPAHGSLTVARAFMRARKARKVALTLRRTLINMEFSCWVASAWAATDAADLMEQEFLPNCANRRSRIAGFAIISRAQPA